MRKTLLSTLAVAILLGTAGVCPAQETKTLVTVSFSGYDALLENINYIGGLGGNADLGKMIDGMLKEATGGQGLAGLDTSKPWGVVVQTDGQDFPIFGFVPVKDLNQLMTLLKTLETGEAPTPPADGVWELETDGPTLYVQQKGTWAVVVINREHLAKAPADPLPLLGGMEKKYELAVRGSISNVPEMFRQMFAMQIQAGAEMALGQMPGESDEDYAIRTGMAKQMLQQTVDMINELDEVLLGFAVDQSAGVVLVDFEITAVSGTKLATQFAQVAATTTNFAGFDLPGAAVVGNWAGTLTDDDVTQTKAMLTNIRATALKEIKNEGLSAAELQLATQLLTDLIDVIEKTVENKKADGGMVLMLEPDGLTFAAGGVIAEGATLEKLVKQLAALASNEDPDFAKMLKLDAETYENVRFHTLAVPVPEFEEEAQQLFGQTLDVALGISTGRIYLGIGKNALATVKQVIDQSKSSAGKKIPPFRLSVAATPIAKFVAALAPDEQAKQMAGMLAGVLEESAGKDHLTITSKPITNGANVRIELEEGLLKLIGQLSQMAQGMMMGGPGGPPETDAPF